MNSSSLIKSTLTLLGLLFVPAAAMAENDAGAVYTESNSASGNRVMYYARDGAGALRLAGSFPTGGAGTGAGLGSQGAVAMTENGRFLLAVNAGSNDVSVFRVGGSDLVLTDKVGSGGVRPISVTVERNLVYVLNAGGGAGSIDTIAGFFLTHDGRLLAIPGSTRRLSAASTGPAQISFAPSGDHLVVTEKATNLIFRFAVDENGVAGAGQASPSAGATPFGFAFTPAGTLIVSEAAGGVPGASGLSSYRLKYDGGLATVTASLPTAQTAACWVAVARNGRYAYATNTGSNTVTGVGVSSSGAISLLRPDGISAVTGRTPIDVAVSCNEQFLYVLTAGDHAISQYRIRSDGSLDGLGTIGGLPVGTVGLVAR